MDSRTCFGMVAWLAFVSASASAANPLPIPLPVEAGSSTWDVAFSRDGSLVAASIRPLSWAGLTNSDIRIFDVSSRKEVKRLEVSSPGIQWLGFTPDGKYLANGDDALDHNELRFWNISNWKVERRFDGFGETLDISADGRFLAHPTDEGKRHNQVVRYIFNWMCKHSSNIRNQIIVLDCVFGTFIVLVYIILDINRTGFRRGC